MAVAYESDGGHVFANANNNNAVSITLPATRPVGSVLLFVAWCRLISAAAPAPTGYTLLSTHTSGTASGGRLWIYAKQVVGGETAPSVTPAGATGTSGDLWAACIYCYSGVDLTGGISAILDGTPTTQDASGTTTCTFPDLTISSDKSFVVRTLCRFRDAVDTFTFTTNWAEREDAGSTTRTGGQGFLQDKQATASGAQGTVTVAPSNTTASRYLAVTLALKAAAVTHTGVSQSTYTTGIVTAATAERKAVSQSTYALGAVTIGTHHPTHFGVTQSTYALGVVTAGKYVGRGVSQSTYAFGASTDGTVGAPGQSGEVSTSFVFGTNTNGQLTRRGVSQSTYTAGIVTVGQKGRSGISQSTYTLGVQTVGTARPTAYGISQNVYTLGVATAGKYVARGNITTPLVLTTTTVGRAGFRGISQFPITVSISVDGYTVEPMEILGGVTMGILVDISAGRGYSFAAMEEFQLEAPFVINPLFIAPPDNLNLTAMQEKTN